MMRPRGWISALAIAGLVVGGVGKGADTFSAAHAQPATSSSLPAGRGNAAARATVAPKQADIVATPVTMRVAGVPIPVKGSDARFHLVYEIELANWVGDKATISNLAVQDARNGRTVGSLDTAGIASRLVVRDRAAAPGSLGAAQSGLLYLHLVFDTRREIPSAIEHRLSVIARDRTVTATAARTRVAPPTDLVLDPPLRGSLYIAGDGCCDSVRHIRATLPVNGSAYTAQRFAIDWEQLDEQGRIYVGDPKVPESYHIYGKRAYAVADARVVAALDGLPNSPIGALPQGIPIEHADGNHVVLELHDGRYALYAHFQPGSVRVTPGQAVRRGQVLGLVGTSGNSSEPHLHFHVMDGPSALASNGVPYLLRGFTSSRRGADTAAFDQAIIDGKAIPTETVRGDARRRQEMPLDLWIVDFP